jgi:hypothetical protein
MSLELTEHEIDKAVTLDLDPSLTIAQFCRLEHISKPRFYNMPDRPAGYYQGDSLRIPQSERLKWRARQMAAAPEIAKKQSAAARARNATGAARARAKQEA